LAADLVARHVALIAANGPAIQAARAATTTIPVVFFASGDPELVATHAQAQAISGVTSLGYLFQLLAMTGWTSLPWLWSLRQPTLVLTGRDDPLVPSVNGRILARLIPNAQLQMIDDGHLFMVTRPIETAMAIEAFLWDQ
jgi:pimeloyl-ACP methyl ester carboxylesterase